MPDLKKLMPSRRFGPKNDAPSKALFMSHKQYHRVREMIEHITLHTGLSMAKVVLWAVRVLYVLLVEDAEIPPNDEITEDVLYRVY